MHFPRKVFLVPASIVRTDSRRPARADSRPTAVPTHRQARGWFAPVAAFAVFASGLFAMAPSSAAQDRDRGSQVDTTHQVRTFETTPHADPDSAAIFGDGVNPGPGPIVRMGPHGQEIKDVGSRLWRPVGSGIETDNARRRAEKIRRYGHLPLAIATAVRDSADLTRLLARGDTASCAPPCTTVFHRTVKHFYELRDAGIRCWEWKPPRQPKNETPDPPKSAAPEQRGSSLNGLAPSIATSVFSEGWETSTIPGTFWSATDYNQGSGLDYWKDVSTSCGSPHGGSWMASASGNGDVGCLAYDNDQSADLQYTSYVNMSGYAAFAVTFWANYNTENGYDNLTFQPGGFPNPTAALVTMTGSSGGWVQKQVTFNNQSGTYNSLYLRFVFASDYIVTASGGVFIDDVSVDPIYPNLVATTPSGWSGPIVPSMVTGTTTTGSPLLTGQTTYIDWAIRNAGQAAAGGFWIDYYLDNGFIGSDYVSSLAANTTYTRLDWGYVVSTAGQHTLKMVIDPTGAVAESNEGDNVYQATFTWANPPAPDLVVQSMTVTVGGVATTSPTMGQTIDVAVVVKNQGTATASGPFYVDWYQNRTAAPSPGVRGDQNQTISSLGAGATQTLHYYATGTRAETWNMYAYADPTNLVLEGTNEGNNVLGPVQVVWVARQLYITGTFSYDDSILGPDLTIPCNLVVAYDTKDKCAGCDSTKLDSLAAGTITDNISKRFTIGPILNEDVNDDHGFLDIVVKVYYQSDEGCWNASYPHNWFITMIDSTSQRRHYDSALYRDVTADTLTVGPRGHMKPTDYGNRWALHLYKTLVDGWSYIRNVVTPPEPIPHVFVQWAPGFAPVGGTAYDPNRQTIQVDGQSDLTSFSPDEIDDGILLHEYGHHLAYAFGFDFSATGADHSLEAVDGTLGDAWSEGWAHFFGAAVRPWLGGFRTDYGRSSTGLVRRRDYFAEGDSVVYYKMLTSPGLFDTTQVDTSYHVIGSGAQWEACVAGALWDIYDSRNDRPTTSVYPDSLSDGFNNLWNAFRIPLPWRVADVRDARTVYDSLYATPFMPGHRFWFSQWIFWQHGIMGAPAITGVAGAPSPQRLRIIGASPNPFNPVSRIRYVVPENAAGVPVSLRVYDVSGRLVRTLAKGIGVPGLHDVEWNGRSQDGIEVASGMYFLRLESMGSRSLRKLTLLK